MCWYFGDESNSISSKQSGDFKYDEGSGTEEGKGHDDSVSAKIK